MQANNDGFTESTPCYAEVNSSSEYVHVVFNKKNECSVENGIVDATSSGSNKKRWIFGSVLAIALTFSFFYFFMIIAGITQYAHWNSMKSMPGNFSNILGWDEFIFHVYQQIMFQDAKDHILNHSIGLVDILVCWFPVGFLWNTLNRDISNQKKNSTGRTKGLIFLTAFVLISSVIEFFNGLNFRTSVSLLIGNLICFSVIYLIAFKFKSKKWICYTSILAVCLVLRFSFFIYLDGLMRYLCTDFNHLVNQPDFSDQKMMKSLQLIKNFASKEGFPASNIIFLKGFGNAFVSFTGFNHYMIFGEELVSELTDDEILGVTAHELGHFINRDLIFDMVFYRPLPDIVFPLFILLVQSSEFFYGSIGLAGLGRPIEVAIPLANTFTNLLFNYLQPFYLIYSRFREDRADRNAVRLKYGLGLYNFLKKYSHRTIWVDASILYKFVKLVHPSILVRLSNLKKYIADSK